MPLVFAGLIQNLSFLVALSVVSGFVERRWRGTLGAAVLQGTIFGTASVIGMLTPLVLGPGLIFDGRSVMVSLGGLFFGPWAAAVSAVMAAVCRALQGGVGTYTGILVILSSALWGVVFHRRWTLRGVPASYGMLWGFGVGVHVAMLLLMFTLPGGAAWLVLRRIGLPVMLAYPLATVLIGAILSDQRGRIRLLGEMRENEERLRLALHATNQGLFDLNCQTGETLVNPEYARMLGYDPGSFRESHEEWVQRLHPEDREAAVGAYEGYVAGLLPEYRAEYRMRSVSGDWRWVLSLGKVMEWDDRGRPLRMLGTHTDITPLKKAEEALRLIAEADVPPGEDIFRFLVRHMALSLDMSHAFIARLDPGEPGWGHCVAGWGPQGFRESGFSFPLEGLAGEVVSRGSCLVPSGIRGVFPRDARLEELGAQSGWGTLLRGGDGKALGLVVLLDRRPLEVDPSARSLFRSFASRLTGEMERQRTEEKYQTLFREMLDGFAVHEILCDETGKPTDYRFVAVNPAFEKMTGLRGEEILGRRVKEVLPGTEESWIETYGRVALTGEPVHFESYSQSLEKHFEVTAYCPQKGQFACLFADVTARKKAEQERNRLEDQVRQAQKMDSIGRLAGGVAHDLNNLLTPILGYGEILQAEFRGDEEKRECVEEILRAGQRARDLVAQLLAFGRKQVLEFRTLDLNEVVRGFEKLLRRTIREDIKLRFFLQDPLPPIRGDAGQLEQVLLNLAVNAQDAMPQGGVLTVETGAADLDEAYAASHQGMTAGRHVLLVVSDSGKGMDEEMRAHLFEPFYTTKEKGKGTGLGLATVYGIVRQHGGCIWAYGEPGQGMTFKLFFPQGEGGEGAPPSPEASSRDLRGQETILLVEDNDMVRSLACILLRRQGYTVLPAADGKEALSVLESHGGAVHLLLTDVVMPEMNGRVLYDAMKVRVPDIRVLFMSGYTENVIAHQGVLDPGVHFLPKPFSAETLAAKVREALEQP